jgi:ABC-2 type transport system permease protein
MTWVLISLTTRQLLGCRRTALIGLVLALPVIIAVIYRVSDKSNLDETSEEFALALVGVLILTLLLPLVALVLGTAALGAEIEDGTAVFLLTKPIPRWKVVVVKIGVSSVTTILMVVPATAATTWIIHESPTADGLVIGLALAAAVSALLYCAVFVALSTLTSRALIIGLIYVFVWEAIITNLFNALRWLSIREYASGWSDASISLTDTEIYDPRLGTTSAIIASLIVLAASGLYGARMLSRFEIGERS